MTEEVPSFDSIFWTAIEIGSAEERASYLASACGEDAELRLRVEKLVAAHFRAGRFLDEPAPELEGLAEHRPDGAAALALDPTSAVGSVIGRYKLLELIGVGGMGAVYVAEAAEPATDPRRVALKLIRPGMDSAQVIARFEAERKALALMDHPNIARILDAGTTQSGRPYFVMELVRGLPITEYCDREQLSVRERLKIFVAVCLAVQHAHQKGIIHRDLKPSNILVTRQDGAPIPKVIDLGIAKATGQNLADNAAYTAFWQLLGTPLYMSPEQADPLGLDDVDTRSDIYSLGIVLYELLTGTTPVDREMLGKVALGEVHRIIRDQETQKPSTRLSSLGEALTDVSARRQADPARLGRSLRGGLDWVVMKALEKERQRRYETAHDFATDLTRYLHDEPVMANPPSTWYRFGKFARRNRVLLTATSLVALALVGWAMSATALLWESRRQERRADRNAIHLATTLDKLAERIGEEFAIGRSGLTSFGAEVLGEAAATMEVGVFENAGIGSVELGTTLNRLALIRLLLGDAPTALRHSERAEAVFAALPPSPEARAGLAAAWLQSGRLLAALDRYPEARKRTEQAASLLRTLVAERPADPDLRYRLARAELNLGNIALRDRPDEAVTRYRTALDHLASLRRTGDRPLYVEWDARARSNLGLLMGQLGRPAEAVRLQSEAVELAERFVASRPGSVRPIDCLATCRNNLGESLAGADRLEEAESAFRAALESYRDLARRLPDEPEGPWGVAMVQTNLADTLLHRGRPGEAVAMFEKAGEAFARLVKRLPNNPVLREHAAQHRALLSVAREQLRAAGSKPDTKER